MSVVRARLKDGRETNLAQFWVDRLGAEVLDEPTHRDDRSVRPDTGRDGRPLKVRVTVDEAAASRRDRIERINTDADADHEDADEAHES